MKNNIVLPARQIPIVFIGFYLLSAAIVTMAAIDLTDNQIRKIEKSYGQDAAIRVRNWRDLIQSSQALSDEKKLKIVNDFFNENILFVNDISLWGKEDYWATPFQCLGMGAGDCEDFSIAKYFTLRELGIPDNKLRLTYVKALSFNQAHMVCTYFATPSSVPLVLDNLIPTIEPATNRADLLPVYSFNGTGLWLAKERGSGKRVGGSSRLSLWEEMKQRMVADIL